jgi:hypothetical protein
VLDEPGDTEWGCVEPDVYCVAYGDLFAALLPRQGFTDLPANLGPGLELNLSSPNLIDATQHLVPPGRVNLVLGFLGRALEQRLSELAAFRLRQRERLVKELLRG